MIVDSSIVIEFSELSEPEWRVLLNALTFNDGAGAEIKCYRLESNGVKIPRGALSLVPGHLEHRDLRSKPLMPKLAFTKTLDAEGHRGQLSAVKEMIVAEQGQVIRQPGTGKTQIALAFAAACRTRTLVVVHTKDIFQQWLDYSAAAIPNEPIGRIAGGRCEVEQITIAMAQTLKRYVNSKGGFWRQFGCLIIDEAHHSAAETWEWILNVCPAFYRFGLTATRKRADGRERLNDFLLGPAIHNLPFSSPYPVTIVPVETQFHTTRNGAWDYSHLVNDLVADEGRNKLIARMVNAEIATGHPSLVLSRQIGHLDSIKAELDEGAHSQALVVTGEKGKRFRNQAVRALREGKTNLILATQLFDEAIDIPRLSRVFLTYPGKHDGRIIQQVGRALRTFDGKTEAIVYDFVDSAVPSFRRQFMERCEAYDRLGFNRRKGVKVDAANQESRWVLRRRFR